jgi:hypothetical protein
MSQLLNYNFEITVIPNETQLLLLFQYLYLSVGTKMNLHGPGRLKVVNVVMRESQGYH